ncbi:MAG: fructose-bisphosphate aldolase [Candidatus Aenigmarchaeota archaeon]|nr:fructose-bisphosphate aldolase [Candidatus Aenigmarchaeota archaeon]
MGDFEKRFGKICKSGRVMLCAMDQGMEHGPRDFNDTNINPEYVFDIADKGGFTGMVVQKGVAYKYDYANCYKTPLVLKLNGKTEILPKEGSYSAPLATVKDALRLGADAVGYTIYVGSPREADMFREFAQIHGEAMECGMPTIIWAYPRGKYVPDEKKPEVIAYAARVALELGADITKVNYTGSTESFKKVVQAAQRTKVISSGGSKLSDEQFIAKAKEVMQAGAAGFAVGRNVWQNENPLKITAELRKVIFGE